MSMSLVSFGRMRSAAMNTINSNVLPIAIDFGVSSLKVIQVTGGETTSLIAAACLPTPEDFLSDAARRFDFQFKALPRLIKSVGFKGKRAVCAIPAAQTFCKHIQFPRAENIDLAELVRQAVPAALECAPDALVYRHVTVTGATPVGAVTGMGGGGVPTGPGNGPGGAKQEVICLAASRHFVGQIMDAIREAKLEPVGMHPECFATVKAFEQLGRRETDKSVATLYLDMAYGSTKVWISHGSDLVFAKTIIVGGRDLDTAVSRSADCNLAAARAMRLNAAVLVAEPRRPGVAQAAAPTPGGLAMLAAAMAKVGASEPATPTPADSATATDEDRRTQALAPGFTSDVSTQAPAAVAPPEFDVREPLEMLTDELAGCLRYHQSLFGGRRVDRVIFVGGESRHRGLCQHVARKIRTPAHVADPLARMARTGREPCHGIDFGAMQPGWTVAYGLGLCPTDC
jgi:Tfp pilus assembly PilM family ATPase